MENYLASIMICGFPYTPRGYASCDGQLIPIRQNTALFSLLSTNFGGDGQSTFGLPDLRGMAPIHPDQQTIDLGNKIGSEGVTLIEMNLPPHTHAMAASANTGGASPVDSYPGGGGQYDASAANVTMSPLMLASAGGSEPVRVMKPYTVMNFVIAINGWFPARW